jgi:ABC-type sulfate transport system substrate-binding protein
MSVIDYVNHELSSYSDKEIEAEFVFRKLGAPYSDEISLTAFSDLSLAIELVRRGYSLAIDDMVRIKDAVVSKDAQGLADAIRDFLYHHTGFLTNVQFS